MLVSTKGRYALRVMIDLAGHNDGSLVRLQDIADRQQISEKYLEGDFVCFKQGKPCHFLPRQRRRLPSVPSFRRIYSLPDHRNNRRTDRPHFLPEGS